MTINKTTGYMILCNIGRLVRMSGIKNVYLIGLGAVGGAVAGRIHGNCPGSLKIIVDSDRLERYSKTGITINGEVTGFNLVKPGEINQTADLIIIAVKQHHLAQAIKDIRTLVGPGTIILSLLNGISSEEIIGREYGMDKMLYSFFVGTDALRTGTDIYYKNIGRIVFGDRSNSEPSVKVRAVRDFFDKAQVPYNIPEDMIREQWWKFMMNVGINQVSAVLRAPYGLFTVPGDARDLMSAASREVIALSRKLGINLNEEDIEKYIKVLETISPLGKTSMLQDVEAGRKTEVESLILISTMPKSLASESIIETDDLEIPSCCAICSCVIPPTKYIFEACTISCIS
jgi:2-dehydropantoate 2-reductase